MNFICPSLKRSFFFFLINFICFFVHLNDTQALNLSLTPIYQDFPLSSRITEQGISDVQFDEKGLLYLSSSSSIFIYDGNIWHQVYAGSDPKVTISQQGSCLVFSGNTIYKLSLDERNHYRLSDANIVFPYEEKIVWAKFLGNKLIIVTEKNVYISNEESYELIQALPPGTRSFFNEETVILINNSNLSIINKDLKVENYEKIPENINEAVNSEDGMWFLADQRRNLSLYDLKSGELLKGRTFERAISDFSIVNRNELYVLFEDNSVAQLNFEKEKSNFEEVYFQDDLYSNLIVTGSGKLWITGNKKIKILDYGLKICSVDNSSVNHPEDFVFVKDQLYLLYQDGLYDHAGQNIFTSDEGIRNIFTAGGKLFLDRKKDLLELDPEAGTEIFYPIEAKFADCLNADNYLFKSRDSIFVYQFSEDRDWKKLISLENEGGEYCIFSSWLCTVTEEVLVLMHLENGNKEFYKVPGVFSKEQPVKLLASGDNLWLYNSRHVYTYNLSSHTYQKEKLLFSSTLRIEEIFVLDKRHLLIKIRSISEPGSFVIIDRESGGFRYLNIPGLPAYFFRYQVEDLDEDRFLIGSEKGLKLVYKTTIKRTSDAFHPVFIQAIFGKDTLIDDQAYDPRKKKVEIDKSNGFFRGNSLKIKFSDTDYLYPVSFFQYKLNEESEWTEWTQGNIVVLDNLSSGNYQLFLRLMNSQGEISKSGSLDFSIPKPILLTWPILVFLVLIILIAIFIVYKWFKLSRLKTVTDEPDVKAYYREEPKTTDVQENGYGFKASKREREGQTRWDKYEMVTVLFSDIQGFTKIAEQMNPESLIDELDRFFFHFDSVVEKYNIEKIKTIGDAYMAAGGIPQKNRSNPIEVVLAALEMQQYMLNLQKTKVDFWDLRIGIHTGPVIAGVVGHKKRSYDIWGDTVNTASRMESSGEAGKVNISGETYGLVREYFLCEYRGRLPVKYKGNLDMYFVKGLRPELSINLAGIPNRKFFLKLNLLRLLDLEEHVFKKLQEESPSTHYFHTPEYAHHLYSYSELLSKAENLDLEEKLLIKASVLLLITGFIENYENPEIAASKISMEILKDFHFTENQVHNISNLILASKCPPEPNTLLEKIMVDIRYEYLGRADFINLYKKLFQELKAYNENLDFNTWKEEQIKLLKNHKFYTSGARRLSEIPFSEQLDRISREEL